MINLSSGVDLIEDMRKEAFPFSEVDIDRTDYYLTDKNDEGLVKLGQRITLKDGSKYGKIIPIPLDTLKSLIKDI